MKKLLATLAVVGFTAPAMAQAVDFSAVDTDGSGTVSWEEVQAAAPEITQDEFDAADVDGAGELTQEQYEGLAGTGGADTMDAPADDGATDDLAPVE